MGNMSLEEEYHIPLYSTKLKLRMCPGQYICIWTRAVVSGWNWVWVVKESVASRKSSFVANVEALCDEWDKKVEKEKE